jgi:hypothetical protein
MERTTLEKFFTGKLLQVPPYQRNYAWQPSNVDELWEDIREALDTKTSHYLGTFILARGKGDGHYDLVDGQQRLTTLTMMLTALVNRLPSSEDRRKVVAEDRYIKDANGDERLTLLGDNHDFFKRMIAGQDPKPQNGGQKRLLSAFDRIKARVEELAKSDPTAVVRWLQCLSELNVLEFIEEDSGHAIRIFATVNDRGRPLTTTEKIKSFLIYGSNRYLNGELDVVLQERFSRIFHAFDSIKEIGKDLGIEFVSREQFAEDAIVRYHFLAYSNTHWDYKVTEEGVLADFLKPAAKRLVNSNDVQGLRRHIDDYSGDLANFFEALAVLFHRAQMEPRYYKLLVSLPLSASLYPLTVRLALRGLLDLPLPGTTGKTFLDAIETVDLRVYKTRATEPKKDVFELARDASSVSAEVISTRLRDFATNFMWDEEFRRLLSGNVYEFNEGAGFVLLEYDEMLRRGEGKTPLGMPDLREMWTKEPTIDHVLAQRPSFDIKARGFRDDEHYSEQLHRLGNLALVEKTINSSGNNKTPEEKAREDNLYKSSAYLSTRRFGARISAIVEQGGQYDATEVDSRDKEMVEFCMTRWPLW